MIIDGMGMWEWGLRKKRGQVHLFCYEPMAAALSAEIAGLRGRE